jgi:hypothetical protein
MRAAAVGALQNEFFTLGESVYCQWRRKTVQLRRDKIDHLS